MFFTFRLYLSNVIYEDSQESCHLFIFGDVSILSVHYLLNKTHCFTSKKFEALIQNCHVFYIDQFMLFGEIYNK